MWQSQAMMNMNKWFWILIFSVMGCSNLSAQKAEEKSKYFKVIKAVRTTLYPGVQGSPIIMKVEIMLVARKKGHFLSDSFWYKGMRENVQIFRADKKIFDGNVKKGDTLILHCQVYKATWDANITPENDRIPGSPAAVAPLRYTGELLFRYNRCGKVQYFGVVKTEAGAEVFAP